MADITQKAGQTANTEPVPFELLPEAIRLHLNSSETLAFIMQAEQKFSISEEKVRVIPFVISAVVEGELDPRDVVEMLKIELNLSMDKAKELAAFIKDKILNPIAGGLLIVSGIDIESMPGSSAKDAKDAPGLAAELAPLFPSTQGAASSKPSAELEPLRVSPVAKQPSQPGMTLPPLRPMPKPMQDISAPKPTTSAVAKPVESAQVTAAKPFMLHEEKPLAPEVPVTLRVDKNFTFEAGGTRTSSLPTKPTPARVGASFDSMIGTQKPPVQVPSKTSETPKVVHYTSLKTSLEEEKPKS